MYLYPVLFVNHISDLLMRMVVIVLDFLGDELFDILQLPLPTAPANPKKIIIGRSIPKFFSEIADAPVTHPGQFDDTFVGNANR